MSQTGNGKFVRLKLSRAYRLKQHIDTYFGDSLICLRTLSGNKVGQQSRLLSALGNRELRSPTSCCTETVSLCPCVESKTFLWAPRSCIPYFQMPFFTVLAPASCPHSVATHSRQAMSLPKWLLPPAPLSQASDTFTVSFIFLGLT